PTRSGVRAQALMPDGKLVDDFLIVKGKNSIHVCNAPSPAATASLEIARFIANQLPEITLAGKRASRLRHGKFVGKLSATWRVDPMHRRYAECHGVVQARFG
ncbi:MAG TPA: hypothetical protein VGH55_07860, partial [Chthoniobacterales bacterium]